MEEKNAINALAALAQEHRLRIFRLLVRQGTGGMPASHVAEAVGISRTSVSFHLKELESSGLLRSWREGRNIRYAVHVHGMRELLAFLTEDCCDGHPEICGDTIVRAKTACEC
jgi:ArsR family transcriptional regulator